MCINFIKQDCTFFISSTFEFHDICKKKEMLLETHCKYNTIHVLDGIKNNKQHVKIFLFYFIHIFILLTPTKMKEALLHRARNYLNLLPKMQRYFSSVVTLILIFELYRDKTKF